METLNVFFFCCSCAVPRSFTVFDCQSFHMEIYDAPKKAIAIVAAAAAMNPTSAIITQFNVLYNIKVEIQTKDKKPIATLSTR